MSKQRLQKRHRDLLHLLGPTMTELGISLAGFDYRGSGHLRLHLDLGGGLYGWLTVANSPSDFRLNANLRADLRREAARRRA